MKQKNLVVGGLVAATLQGGSVFTLRASAANNSQDTLASKIATKFNLKQDDVQNVIDQNRTEHHAQMRADMNTKLTDRLAQAVKDGKLTEDQKTKILQHFDSEEGFFETLKDKTDAERRTAMQAHRDEEQKWAKDNGIDLSFLMPGVGHRGGFGRGGQMTGGESNKL